MSSFKNILIISDNLYLCKQFQSIISELGLNELNWTYSISPFSSHKNFESELNTEVLIKDLKNEKDVDEICGSYDLIFSIHCKQFFPPKIVNNIKCINVHPGYNPINRGWYPQVFAIINDLPIGATIHEIDNELDNGGIIDRCFVEKTIYDTSLTLYNKVIESELKLIRKNLISILNNNYVTTKPESYKNNLFLKKDFNELCKIDLEKSYKAKDFINLLRALSHGDYSNAYFIDPNTEKKVYLRLDIKTT